MKLDKLTRLISALNEPAQRVPTEDKNASSNAEVIASSTEAVTFSDGLAEGAEARSRRVQDIKAQVEAGTYKPDSREVAKSLVKELFAF